MSEPERQGIVDEKIQYEDKLKENITQIIDGYKRLIIEASLLEECINILKVNLKSIFIYCCLGFKIKGFNRKIR